MDDLSLATPSALFADPFTHGHYTIERKFWSWFGRDFHVYDPIGNLCLFVQHKVFSWKDEWNIYPDEGMTRSLVRVKAREAIALNVTTDIFDTQSGARVGTVRHGGLKSMLRDTWDVLDEAGNVIGEFKEDSNGLLRRLFPAFLGMPIICGRWHLTVHEQQVMQVLEERKLFYKRFHVTLSDVMKGNGARFALGCALLAMMREIARERS